MLTQVMPTYRKERLTKVKTSRRFASNVFVKKAFLAPVEFPSSFWAALSRIQLQAILTSYEFDLLLDEKDLTHTWYCKQIKSLVFTQRTVEICHEKNLTKSYSLPFGITKAIPTELGLLFIQTFYDNEKNLVF